MLSKGQVSHGRGVSGDRSVEAEPRVDSARLAGKSRPTQEELDRASGWGIRCR